MTTQITTSMTCQEILNYAQPKTDLEIVLYEKLKALVGELYDHGVDPEDVEFSVEGVF